MAWNTPKDWVTGAVVTEADLDTHVRDNLRYLKGLDGAVVLNSTVAVGLTGSPSSAVQALHQVLAFDSTTARIGVYRAAVGVSIEAASANYSDIYAYDYGNNIGKDLVLQQYGGGKLGIGAVPSGRLHVKGGALGGQIFWDYDGVAGSAISILPASSVTATLTCTFAIKASGGGVAGGTMGLGIIPGATQALYSVGSDACSIRVNANGSVDVLRTSGSMSYKVSLSLLYI